MQNTLIRTVLIALALSLGLPATGFAQNRWDGWDYKYDREILPWSEMQGELPAYPVESNLIPLNVGASTPHQYFIDAASVSTGNDGVVRYTMVIKTAGGAVNVSFEGIRCESYEQKFYAIGRSDRSWVRARNPQWREISTRQSGIQHATLYEEFFCKIRTAEPAERIVRALRRGPQLRQILD